MVNVEQIQQALRDFELDGWLFFDVWSRDPLAYRVLGLNPAQLSSRRWYYFVPANGNPTKLVHSIEANRLDGLPGEAITYSTWQQLHARLGEVLRDCHRVAMQYSPQNDLFVISYVDGGTVDLVRSKGVDVVSSADLIQRFVSNLDKTGIASHEQAAAQVQSVKNAAFELIFSRIRAGMPATEVEVQSFILDQFAARGLTCEGLKPVVAVNDHAANPHFDVTTETNKAIRDGDRILIDLWAKIDDPAGIYYDITWCGYAGRTPPEDYVRLFEIVVEARAKAKDFITVELSSGRRVFGWQVDDVCRAHISQAGYGDYFTHRTGHSIDTKVHGAGVNLDNYETKDHREIVAGSCFSIEPGIYLDEMGVRSEINALVDDSHKVRVFGDEQQTLVVME